VGCKVYHQLVIWVSGLSFTLTMWDVKKLEESQGYAQIEVLP